MNEKTSNQDYNRNPEGRGGFGDNPENINKKGWNPAESYSYWLRKFGSMPIEQFKTWLKDNTDYTLDQEKAWYAQYNSRKELAYLKEVTDRTEGKAPQSVDITTKGESVNAYKELTVEELRKLAEE